MIFIGINHYYSKKKSNYHFDDDVCFEPKMYEGFIKEYVIRNVDELYCLYDNDKTVGVFDNYNAFKKFINYRYFSRASFVSFVFNFHLIFLTLALDMNL